MKIEESYLTVSGFFNFWVRFMEIRTRNMEVQDSKINDLRILIISPPTDRGIKVLTEANPKGESHLLCFSEALGKIAKEYSIRYNLEGLKICVEPFFSIPFDDSLVILMQSLQIVFLISAKRVTLMTSSKK